MQTYKSYKIYNINSIMYSQQKRHRGTTLDISIETFLAQIEKKAYRIAEIATKNRSDALDILQDTMIKLVEKYSDKPPEQWKPLFYRILHNKIMDHFRRQKIYNGLFFWKKTPSADDKCDDEIVQTSDPITPERKLSNQQDIHKITLALKKLSPRQQQCFMLRSWEGLSVSETARIMNCSEGSIKTHYFRARATLQKAIHDE